MRAAGLRWRRHPVHPGGGLGAGASAITARRWATIDTAAASRSHTAATPRRQPTDFWAALNIATTQRLPMLFYIEDNGYRHLRQSRRCRLRAATSLKTCPVSPICRILDGDGSDPGAAARLLQARPWPARDPAPVRSLLQVGRAATLGPFGTGHADLQIGRGTGLGAGP